VEIVECAVCQGAVTALDNLIQNKDVDTKIEELLEKSCNSVPAKYYEKVKKWPTSTV
jgi:saposin